ncbi:UDP-N-acetylmuramoyl-tripeptide--D-alanyl-D-alanine ligase [Salirhabdus sp. Marseille-P4669]|uniref:UDP-N-acetylmuramoyl-tripeptide--D-alanyl-D- alanine ligase n=1 Tax=Salirhabdus sp. Marseille-P4669 TaxID=2042310 RepID=UPI001F2DA990|nr:UDP-N-acetylmuramoyl-tripeptide--D-alanyl-D-alanine ligase [Salirhabdus sp. Marseille-P4669]
MIKFTTRWLTTIFPTYRGLAKDAIQIEEAFTDSRKKVHFGLFIPIVGENFDGHDFLKDAIQNGAVGAIWQKDKEIPSYVPTDFPLFLVDDTIVGMQRLAAFYREKVNPKVIAITGSNGKTTTKDFFANVFERKYKTWKTQGNLNNHIGLPLTILQMDPDVEVLIVEMGMNHFGEIETLSKIARPNFAVITNIGESHIEYLGSREGIAKAKSEIVLGLKEDGCILYDGDEPLLETLANKFSSYRIGFNKDNNYCITDVLITNETTSFQLNGEAFVIQALGRHQAKNVSYAIVCAKLFGLTNEEIKQSLENVALTNMRFEKINTTSGALIINDAYNASATSMKASIEVIKEMDATRKVLVLGDILELGAQTKEIHRSVADVIEKPIDALYTYGEISNVIAETVKNKDGEIETFSFQAKTELTKALKKEMQEGTLLLFKASRGMKLEDIIEQLV